MKNTGRVLKIIILAVISTFIIKIVILVTYFFRFWIDEAFSDYFSLGLFKLYASFSSGEILRLLGIAIGSLLTTLIGYLLGFKNKKKTFLIVFIVWLIIIFLLPLLNLYLY